MNCPECKNKISTKRTIVNGSRVTREKHCPACDEKYITVEMFEEDFGAVLSDYENKIHTLESDKIFIQEKYKQQRKILSSFKEMLNEV